MPTLHLAGGHAWKLVFDASAVEYILETDPDDPTTLHIAAVPASIKSGGPSLTVVPDPSSRLAPPAHPIQSEYRRPGDADGAE